MSVNFIGLTLKSHKTVKVIVPFPATRCLSSDFLSPGECSASVHRPDLNMNMTRSIMGRCESEFWVRCLVQHQAQLLSCNHFSCVWFRSSLCFSGSYIMHSVASALYRAAWLFVNPLECSAYIWPSLRPDLLLSCVTRCINPVKCLKMLCSLTWTAYLFLHISMSSTLWWTTLICPFRKQSISSACTCVCGHCPAVLMLSS